MDPISACLLSLQLATASAHQPSFQSQLSLYAGPREDPYPCFFKWAWNQTLSREICCHCVSWDQLYLYPPYDILRRSPKNEVAHLVHLLPRRIADMKDAAGIFLPPGWDFVLVLSRWICSWTHLLDPCRDWCSCASPYPLCPFKALRATLKLFPASGGTSGYAGSLLSQCLLFSAAWSIWLSVWIRKMLKNRRISCRSSLPYSSFSPCHWPDFLT